MPTTGDKLLAGYEALLAKDVLPGRLIGDHLPGRPRDILAVDDQQNFFLLVDVSANHHVSIEARSYRSLEILGAQDFHVRVGALEKHGVYCGILLRRSSGHLLPAFCYLAATLVESLPESPEIAEVVDLLNSLGELLRVERYLNPDGIKGLWGELWLIAQSPDCTLARSWHSRPTNRFDFSLDASRLEVKTHEGDSHLHRFAHHQLEGAPPSTFVISCLVFEDDAGTNVLELADSIAAELPPRDRSLFRKKAAEVLGTSVEQAAELRYTCTSETKKVAVAVEAIPRLAVDQSLPITEISYRVDLGSALADAGMALHTLWSKVGLGSGS